VGWVGEWAGGEKTNTHSHAVSATVGPDQSGGGEREGERGEREERERREREREGERGVCG
jgi:hypothetical protein